MHYEGAWLSQHDGVSVLCCSPTGSGGRRLLSAPACRAGSFCLFARGQRTGSGSGGLSQVYGAPEGTCFSETLFVDSFTARRF